MDNKPVIFIDLETTGTKVLHDRIVQIAATKTSADFLEREPVRKYLINPGIFIPAAATEIHGITNEMVADKPLFKQMAKGFLSFIEGCNIAGFNILNFDVPLLIEEISRAGLKWDITGVLFFDAFRIFREKEKRDLAGAVKFYTGREIEGAHDAGEDVNATIDVLAQQINRYDDLAEMGPQQLFEFCKGANAVDLAGKIVLNANGIPCYSFGKSEGKPVIEDKGFANWMIKAETEFSTDTKAVVKKILGYK